MFRNDQQRSEACRVLLRSGRLDHLWTESGPTEEACALLAARGGYLSGGQGVLLLVAFDFWNGEAKVGFDQIAYRLDASRQRRVAELLIALSAGPDAIDQWIEHRRDKPWAQR